MRYNHRISQDIDLFSDKCIGIAGLQSIREELRAHFGTNILFTQIINDESGDQYGFLSVLINKDGVNIKVEILQNFPLLTPVELIDDVRMLSVRDIGLLKLMSASNRQARKDIYDLDIITDDIPLPELISNLQAKRKLYSREEHKSIFDLDDELSPTDNLKLLLAFDNKNYTTASLRPSHSNDRIDIILPSRDWRVARSSWLKKVNDLMRKNGIAPERPKPIN